MESLPTSATLNEIRAACIKTDNAAYHECMKSIFSKARVDLSTHTLYKELRDAVASNPNQTRQNLRIRVDLESLYQGNHRFWFRGTTPLGTEAVHCHVFDKYTHPSWLSYKSYFLTQDPEVKLYKTMLQTYFPGATIKPLLVVCPNLPASLSIEICYELPALSDLCTLDSVDAYGAGALEHISWS